MIEIIKNGEISLITKLSNRYYEKALAIANDFLSSKKSFELKTSGSTGEPQIITFNRKQLIISANQTGKTFGIMPGDLLFCPISFDHAAGFMMVIRALVLRTSLIITEPSSIPELPAKFDFGVFVPLQIHNLLKNENHLPTLKKAKSILIGGGEIPYELEEQLVRNGSNFFHSFGMTETLTHFAVRNVGENIYRPIEGVKIRSDEEKKLIVSSPVNFGKEIITNDLVEILSDGSFRWIGRADLIINSGGIKLNPEDLKTKTREIIKELTGHDNFFFFGVPDPILGNRLELAINSPAVSNPDFQKHIFSKLKKYEQPKKIHFWEKFVYSELGKIRINETIKLNCGK